MFPLNIKFGPINLSNYEGIYFFIAIVSAVIYLTYICKKEKINLDLIYETVFYALLSALFFGRLFSFIFWTPEVLIQNPLIFFQVWNGGISVLGGLFGGILAGFVVSKIKKFDFLYYINISIPAILLGQIVGRTGCFLNGDASGIKTDLPWGIIYNPDSVAYFNQTTCNQNLPLPNTPLHPTQLYEVFGNVLLFLFFIFTKNNKWINKKRLPIYLIYYSLLRFFIEFFRSDSVKWFSIFTNAQQICILGIFAGIITFIFISLKKQPK
jgi:phosphatidylglycerol---prolipoprotein diacylglyceryl transferase